MDDPQTHSDDYLNQNLNSQQNVSTPAEKRKIVFENPLCHFILQLLKIQMIIIL